MRDNMSKYTTEYTAGGVSIYQDSHLPNPYTTEVEKQAWCEGYQIAVNSHEAGDNDEEIETRKSGNPYTSGDTTVAWAQGFEDFSYHPAPFNPADIINLSPTVQNYINVVTWHDRSIDNPAVVRGTYLLWSWTGGNLDGAPEWADNRHKDRAIKVSVHQLRNMALRTVNDRMIVNEKAIELPCPPYTYEYSGGGMEISVGAFKKWGDKSDWERVLGEMQQKLEEMPAGLDVRDVTISVSCQAQATAMWTKQLDVSNLLSYHGQYEDGVFTGDEDELEAAVEEAVDALDDSDVSADYEEVEYEIDYYGETQVTANDLTYDLQEVTEA